MLIFFKLFGIILLLIAFSKPLIGILVREMLDFTETSSLLVFSLICKDCSVCGGVTTWKPLRISSVFLLGSTCMLFTGRMKFSLLLALVRNCTLFLSVCDKLWSEPICLLPLNALLKLVSWLGFWSTSNKSDLLHYYKSSLLLDKFSILRLKFPVSLFSYSSDLGFKSKASTSDRYTKNGV